MHKIYADVFCLCCTEINSLLVVLVTMVEDNGMLWQWLCDCIMTYNNHVCATY